MKKYEIYHAREEDRFDITSKYLDLELDPFPSGMELVGSYSTLEEARANLPHDEADFSTYSWHGRTYLFYSDYYVIDAAEYDEDDEYIHGDVVYVSPLPKSFTNHIGNTYKLSYGSTYELEEDDEEDDEEEEEYDD